MIKKIIWNKKIFNDEKTLYDVYDYKKNSFDIIRLGLAILVIVYHAYILYYGLNIKYDPISRILNFKLGDSCVWSFFYNKWFFNYAKFI